MNIPPAPVALRAIGNSRTQMWALWLALPVAVAHGYGECQSVQRARETGQSGAWIAFPSEEYACAVWETIFTRMMSAYN